MEFIRKTVNSKELESLFDLPENLRNKKVEVIVLPIDENNRNNYEKKSLGGRLQKYANPSLIPLEQDAWSGSVVKKYENS